MNVVKLADYRKAHAPVQPEQDRGPSYYCLRCDGAEFKAYSSGRLHCTRCGCRMANLFLMFVEAQ